MTMIDAVSQSTGVERRVEVTATPEGVRVAVRDGKKGTVLGFVTAPAEELMTVLSEQPPGPTAIPGDTAGARQVLGVEVRRNEVWLTVGTVDAAVGLDDLMDAMAAVAG